VQRNFTTHNIAVDTNYNENSGLDIPYGLDIIIFFPEGRFEYIIVDGSTTFMRKQINNSSQTVQQVNILFLQYVMISRNPRLFIRSLEEKVVEELTVVFTTL
jgi:hypothetical protein